MNRHFWSQLKVLKNTYKIPLVLIEGNIDYKNKLVSGIIFSILFGWKIPFVHTYNIYDTAEAVTRMFTRYGSNRAKGYPPAGVKKEMTTSKIRWAMLQCIRGIGPAMATKIIREVGFPISMEMGSIESRMLEENLKKIKGLGESRRNRIMNTFNEVR